MDKKTVRQLVDFALSVGLFWYMTRPPDAPPLSAVVYRKTAQLAQAGAHQLGQLGLAAERNYYRTVKR